MNKDVGDKIKTMRQQKGFTQFALAEKAGIAQSTLSYIEKGTKAPRFETLQALCRAMDITLLELLACGEPTHPTRFFREKHAVGSTLAGSFEQYLYLLLLGKEPMPAVTTSSAFESEIST